MPRKLIAIILSLGCATSHAQGITLPDIGDPSREVLAASAEAELGREVFRRLLAQGVVLEDPFLQDYIDSVGQRIALHARNDAGSFTFFMVNDRAINAFATPGGYIGVNTGLLTATRTEAELAGVLAHEAAHVSQRHIARWFEDSQRSRIPMAASLLAAALLATASGEAGQAAIAGVLAADAQRQLNFSRSNEQEADRVGVDFLLRSGFDPYGMPDFFERLAQTTRFYGGANIPEYLRTHPVEANRIAETRSRVESLAKNRSRDRDPLEYYLAQARVQVLGSKSPRELAQQLQQSITEGNNRSALAQRYGLTLSLQRGGDLEAAAKEADQLLAESPETLPFLIASAEIAVQAGRLDTAMSTYQRAASLYPGDYSLTMSHGDALIAIGEPRKAMNLLRPRLDVGPVRSAALALYARAAQAAGLSAESHATMAEYYKLRGSNTLAIQQIELALRAPDIPPYMRQKLTAELQRLRQEVAEETG